MVLDEDDGLTQALPWFWVAPTNRHVAWMEYKGTGGRQAGGLLPALPGTASPL